METFERDAPLFDRRFHVLVQYPDRDEKLLPLTIRLLNGVRQNSASNQKERVLRVEVTDDDGADPFFLFLWSVSEEEFHELKAQQRLLVDFASFPANLIELLECCLKDSKWLPAPDDAASSSSASSRSSSSSSAGDKGDAPAEKADGEQARAQMARSQGPVPLSYLAVLNTCNRAGESVFSIVETNQFKHLTHLSLQFFPGDDAAVKAYLAARLAQVNAEKRALAAKLRATTADRDERARNETHMQKELDSLQQQTDALLSQERLQYADELNAQRERAASVLKQREDELNAKIDALTQKFEAELRTLKQTADANEAHVQALSKEKYQNELLIDQLRIQSKDLGDTKSVLARELEALRSENKQLDQKAFEQEKQINVLQLRASGLQQQLADKEEVIAKTTEMLQSAQAHNQEVEDSLKMYRDNHARLQQKLELSISEINKGNEIIERIQNESRALKSKIKMKTKIIKQQEQVVEEKQLQREELMLQLKSAREDLRKRDEHIETLKSTIKELSLKLEDSNKLLASNQQVIAWLNKEINDAQIAHQRRTTAHPSVLSFRPSDKKFPGASGGELRPSTQFTTQ